jgi:hypothetical protein
MEEFFQQTQDLFGENNAQNNWQNIHPNFSYHEWDWETNYKQRWIDKGFTYQQTQDWINIGLTPQDYNFAHFLKNIKNLVPEETLNNYQVESLRNEFREYQQSQQQAQILHNPNLPNFQNK